MRTDAARSPLAPWRDGDVWENAATGMRLEVEKSAASTNGASLAWLAAYAPFSPEPPLHLHPAQDERFEVLGGSIRVRHMGEVHDVAAGATLRIGAREPHALWNPSPEPARLRWETRPALRTEAWMGMLLALAAAGYTDRAGVPGLLQMAVLLRAFRGEIRLARPATGAQACVFGPLALLGRMCGLRHDRVARSTRALA